MSSAAASSFCAVALMPPPVAVGDDEPSYASTNTLE
jgi:hypothetical protein